MRVDGAIVTHWYPLSFANISHFVLLIFLNMTKIHSFKCIKAEAFLLFLQSLFSKDKHLQPSYYSLE